MTVHHPITQAEAAKELLRRKRARSSLVAFSQSVEIPGAPLADDPDGWMFEPIETSVALHHRVMLEAIQNCIETDFGRLMIFCPPGSAKSTYASVVAPAWAMGRKRGTKIVATSYADDPIHRCSKRTRQLVTSKEYQNIWPNQGPLVLKKGEGGVKEWGLSNDSSALWAGLLGGITSARADLGIIDDPVSGREDADSPAMRKKTREAYQDDFLTRLKPNASIILMQTRWHLDDLAGSILPEDYNGESGEIKCRDGMTWTVLCMPAKAERNDDPLGRKLGEFLWPEWFTPRHWAIYEGVPRTWNALYQQRPTSGSGGQFDEQHGNRYTKTPKGLRYILSSDFAVTELTQATHPDFTEHVVAGIADENGQKHIYLEAGYSGQKSTAVTIPKGIAYKRTYDLCDWLIEKGKIKNATEPFINLMMEEMDLLIPLTFMPSNKDKIAKAAAFRALWEAGRVHIKEGAWGNRVLAQLCEFPFGRYDDIVDACGQIGRYIDQIAGGERRDKKAKVRRGPKPMTVKWLEMADAEDQAAAQRRREYYGTED